MIEGSLVALITPFKNDTVDEKALRELVDFQIESGTQGLVPCGTTGEAVTLTWEEYDSVVRIVCQQARGRVPVVAGTGSNNTAAVIRTTTRARELGAAAALIVSPYYNKPTQEGLYLHYKAVIEKTRFPVVLYNVPGRTGGNISAETVERLADFEEVVAIKEASGNLNQICEIIQRCGDRLNVLSGDDALTFPILCLGGKGVISTAGNVVPAEVAELVTATRGGDIERGRRLHYQLLEIFNVLYIETNPIPVKTALALMGKIEESFRLPLCEMRPETRKKLEASLRRYELVA
jgi:4-hydroxy-tetrahydrodipicolinate synthase